MKISVDYDDTLADSASILLMLMKWKFGTAPNREDLTYDYYLKNPPTEEAFWGLSDVYDSSYLRRAIPPTDPYVFPVLKELIRNGHRVEVVTRNEPKSAESIRSWCFVHGLDVKVRAIGRGNGAGKLLLPFDVMVDDNPQLAEAMRRHPTKRLILFDQPWNRDVKTGRNVFRAKSWLEVREILRSMGLLG